MRLTLISAPHSSAASFLPSFKARELTVVRGTPSSSAYRRATFKSESIPDMLGISVSLPVKSTAILPDAQLYKAGHSTGMDLTVVLENIERLLKVRKLSAHKASDLAGKPDAIRNIKRKIEGGIQGNSLAIETLDALAKVLGTTSDELRAPPSRINVQSVTGVRETLLAKIAWLDRERDQALRELDALERAELQERKPKKRKIGR